LGKDTAVIHKWASARTVESNASVSVSLFVRCSILYNYTYESNFILLFIYACEENQQSCR